MADASKVSTSGSFDMSVLLSIVTYSICSGSLLLLNKVVLSFIPSAPLVTALQCIACTLSILLSNAFFSAPRLDPLTRPILEKYGVYGLLFVGGIYSNMRSLEASNVDTVIVFRSAAPLIVALGDYVFMGRDVPSPRSLASMALIVVGCASFVAVDAEFAIKGMAAYGWTLIYVGFIAAEMLFGKQITSTLDVTLGTSVLMTNAVGIIPFLAIGAGTGELQRGLDWAHFTPHAISALVASCVLSGGIGFTSWWCRSLVSATSFTVIGTTNKILTILLNILLWSKHSSLLGTCFLLLCILGGAFYQQAPLRKTHGGEGVGQV
jgi:hypothetical protein